MKKKLIKSDYFKISEKYGGGVTSIEEITEVLEALVAKGFFEKRLEKNGQYSYKQKPGVDKEEIEKFLSN